LPAYLAGPGACLAGCRWRQCMCSLWAPAASQPAQPAPPALPAAACGALMHPDGRAMASWPSCARPAAPAGKASAAQTCHAGERHAGLPCAGTWRGSLACTKSGSARTTRGASSSASRPAGCRTTCTSSALLSCPPLSRCEASQAPRAAGASGFGRRAAAGWGCSWALPHDGGAGIHALHGAGIQAGQERAGLSGRL
jgi:hypothetical protein